MAQVHNEAGLIVSTDAIDGELAEYVSQSAESGGALIAEYLERGRKIEANEGLSEKGRAAAFDELRQEIAGRIDPELERVRKLEAKAQVFVDTLSVKPTRPSGVDPVLWTEQSREIVAYLRSLPSDLEREAWVLEFGDDPQVLAVIANAPQSLPILPRAKVDELLMRAAASRYPDIYASYQQHELAASVVAQNVAALQQVLGAAKGRAAEAA